jgi:ribosomal protein S25
MAYTEAAGFLAHAHAWAHPLDLALRDLGLTASTALAAAGAPHRALPQTFAVTANTTAWADPPLDTLPAGDAAIAEALALARALQRLAGRTGTSTSAQAVATAQTLHTLGAGSLDPTGFAAWWDTAVAAPANDRRRRNRRGGERAPPALPPLLAAAGAAQAWMEVGLTAAPAPGQALLLAATSLANARTLHASFLPVWAAYPALGFGDRDALPSLRSDAADRLVGWGERVSWECAFLHLVTDSARMGLQTLERLQTMTEKARGLAVGLDKRARLPDAVDALLRTPVLTPSALAARLKVAPQTATAVLRTLQDAGVIREVTGRGRFRAFAM